MNAVMRKREMAEGTDMPANENDSLGTQVAELRANVGHIQSDVTDIKTDLRTLRKETGDRFEKVEQKLETFRKETGDRFDKVEQKLETFGKETGDRFDTSRKETGDRFDTSRKETGDRFDKVGDRFEKVMQTINELRDSLASAKIWALWLYVGLAGSLFYVLARGFKWL
jgi:chromosome segregation ATPase